MEVHQISAIARDRINPVVGDLWAVRDWKRFESFYSPPKRDECAICDWCAANRHRSQRGAIFRQRGDALVCHQLAPWEVDLTQVGLTLSQVLQTQIAYSRTTENNGTLIQYSNAFAIQSIKYIRLKIRIWKYGLNINAE